MKEYCRRFLEKKYHRRFFEWYDSKLESFSVDDRWITAVLRRAGLAVIAGWVTYCLIALFSFAKSADPFAAKMGQFGDIFGALNSLFTALAILGVMYTAHLQRVQLKKQEQDSARQSREQFLTATLNASMAAFQADQFFYTHRREKGYEQIDELSRNLKYNVHRQRIMLLQREACLGFDLPRDDRFVAYVIASQVLSELGITRMGFSHILNRN